MRPSIRVYFVVIIIAVLLGACETQNASHSVLEEENAKTLSYMNQQISDLTTEVMQLERVIEEKDNLIAIHETTTSRLESQVEALTMVIDDASETIEDYEIAQSIVEQADTQDVLIAMDHALDFTIDSLFQFDVIPYYHYSGMEDESAIFDSIRLWYDNNPETEDGALVLLGPTGVDGDIYIVQALEYRSMEEGFMTYELATFEALISVQFLMSKSNDVWKVVEYIGEH